MITYRSSAKFDKQASVVLIDKDQIKSKKFNFSNKQLKDQIGILARSNQFAGEDGQIFPLVTNKNIILLVGVGTKKGLSLTALRITVRKALLSSSLSRIKNLEVIVHDKNDETLKAVIEAIAIGTYAWKKYVTKKKDDRSVDRDDKKYALVAAKKKAYEEVEMICEGVNLARNLINDNADTVTASYIEKTIRRLVKGKKNISIELLNQKEMKAKKLGLHLAVNQGSNKEPKLIIVKYNGAAKSGDYTAFIGKGITFDTGGINLKPSGHIETMRIDMSGAAAVVGTLKNAIALKLKKNVLFVCALAENSIGSSAFKPGDVVRGYSGKTVEIGNTDAEGRLVLADAISYVVKNYKPARLIDIATLTGACVVALGCDYTGLMTNNDKFSRQLVRSSNDTDDRVWRLPIYPELKKSVESKIADIRNLGYPKGAAGTVTAAEFLRQFTEGTTWAHLDIAGTAFDEGQGRLYFGHGATGAGVRLVTHYLQNN